MPTFADLRSKNGDGLRVAVAAASDAEVLAAVASARKLGFAFSLFGPSGEISRLLEAQGLRAGEEIEVIEAATAATAARAAVALVTAGKAQILMKGLLGTADFMRPILDREHGLRGGRLLSHLAAVEFQGRLLLISDCGLNIAPGLAEKVEILQNAAEVGRALGYDPPRAAILAPVETVNPEIPATIEAAALAKMAERGQIKGVMVDGPLALDNAISGAAAAHKGIRSAIEGMAEILIVPEVAAGNILYKALVYLAGLSAAAIICGARAPIVLTSRADRAEIKLNSLVLAALMHRRQ